MKNKFTLSILIIFLIFCFIIFYKGLNNINTYEPPISDKKKIPSFVAKEFNSKIDISSDIIFEEDIFYIVNIWASWCVPCRTEHPLLMRLNKNRSLKLIGLNYKDNFKKAQNFIDEFGNPYSQIFIDNDGALSIEFGAYGVPETYIIDKDKRIIKKFIGPINDEIVKEIKLLIK